MPPAAHAVWLGLVLVALVRGQASLPEDFLPDPRPALVGTRSTEARPFQYIDATGNWTGFEVVLLEALCARAALECEKVALATQDRIGALMNGTVDFVVEMFSFTAERATQVQFVRPYYYSSGVGLFAPDADHTLLSETGGWDGLRGSPVCLNEGYYANSAIVKNFGPEPVYFTTAEEALAKLAAGECVAIAYDSASATFSSGDVSLVTGVAPVLNAPYGVGVAKGNYALAARLSAALVSLMQDGDSSPILQWEEEFMLAEDFPPNQQLTDMVNAISYFG